MGFSALNTLGPVATAAIHLRAELRCTWHGRITRLGHRHVDHVLPRCEGGHDDPSNLVLACADCNLRRFGLLLTPRGRAYERTREQVKASIAAQIAIPIGPGSEIYPRALEQARIWWPWQFERRERAREAWNFRNVDEFFRKVAA
jgi:hypothetical protein